MVAHSIYDLRYETSRNKVQPSGKKKLKTILTKREPCVYLFQIRTILKNILELPYVFNTIFDYAKEVEIEKDVISNFMQTDLRTRKISTLKLSKSERVLPSFLFSDDY